MGFDTGRRGLLRALSIPSTLLVLGCGYSARTTVRNPGDEHVEPGYSVEATLVGKERSKLEQARTLARAGEYEAAISMLEDLHARGLELEVRREVLLALGEMHGAPLNPHPDLEKASTYLEELLATDPDPEVADRARTLLESYAKRRQ